MKVIKADNKLKFIGRLEGINCYFTWMSFVVYML